MRKQNFRIKRLLVEKLYTQCLEEKCDFFRALTCCDEGATVEKPLINRGAAIVQGVIVVARHV
jgi:hypothetical protein